MKIAFLSVKSLLDINSGAALELRGIIRELGKADHECKAFSFNCYDVGDDYKADEAIDPKLSPKAEQNNLFHYDEPGLRHYLYVGSSKDTMRLNQHDLDQFMMKAANFLCTNKPDVIIFFGSNELLPLLKLGKSLGSMILLYAGTASYQPERQPLFDISDTLIVPTDFIGKLYRKRFGKSYVKIPTTLSFEPEPPSLETIEARRNMGSITLINPTPDKGGHFFMHLSKFLEETDRTFLCVESRGTRNYWRRSGMNPDVFQRIIWAPWQADIRALLRGTAVLAMPSLVEEAAGKVASEAMALGVPCIGFDIGGIKEQIGEGGVLMSFDPRLSADAATGLYKSSVPNEPVSAWGSSLTDLLNSEQRYRALSRLASSEAERFDKQKTVAMWNNVIIGM